MKSEYGIVARLPNCERGIGRVVLKHDDSGLIAGVCIQPYPLWPDDRGYFMEIARMGQGLTERFPQESTQVSAALSYPQTVKAFHYHMRQTDMWAPAKGMFQVALVDLREGSPTFGVRNTFYVGDLRPWRILIPPGVAHGYKVIGREPGMLIYITDKHYNPEDEGRIPYNHEAVAYDWETQHK